MIEGTPDSVPVNSRMKRQASFQWSERHNQVFFRIAEQEISFFDWPEIQTQMPMRYYGKTRDGQFMVSAICFVLILCNILFGD